MRKDLFIPSVMAVVCVAAMVSYLVPPRNVSAALWAFNCLLAWGGAFFDRLTPRDR
jgi:hypothetical protein